MPSFFNQKPASASLAFSIARSPYPVCQIITRVAVPAIELSLGEAFMESLHNPHLGFAKISYTVSS
jgi:hypothetical protein